MRRNTLWYLYKEYLNSIEELKNAKKVLFTCMNLILDQSYGKCITQQSQDIIDVYISNYMKKYTVFLHDKKQYLYYLEMKGRLKK